MAPVKLGQRSLVQEGAHGPLVATAGRRFHMLEVESEGWAAQARAEREQRGAEREPPGAEREQRGARTGTLGRGW